MHGVALTLSYNVGDLASTVSDWCHSVCWPCALEFLCNFALLIRMTYQYACVQLQALHMQ